MNVPTLVELNARARTLVLHWLDAEPQQIAHHELRKACPCAECRVLRMRTGRGHVARDVVITDVRPMGYGLQLVFSDGHDRGIFPWQYLEHLPDDCMGEAHTFKRRLNICKSRADAMPA